jgi:phage shock protein C
MSAQANSKKDQEIKKLFVSTKDRKIFGVCGGIAEYFDSDPTLVRLTTILVTIITGIFPGILAYVVAAIIMPNPPEGT